VASEKETGREMREPDYDSLNLATNPYILKLLRRPGKGGSAEERVIWSSRELKVNAKGRAQLRVLVVTNLAVYNFKPGDYSKFQRRIKLDNVAAISICSESDEFVIHVPEEYDYKYKSAKRKEIAQLLQDLCKKCEKKLKVLHASGKEFEEHIVTKEDVFRLPREEILRRKKLVDFEEHDSDKEEEGGSGPAQQLLETVERLSIEDFTLLKVLGRGAFGKVMLVRKKDSGKVYAMKILKKTMVVAKKQIEHTLAERKVLEAFRHPFLMGLKFAFQTEAKLYLVLDFFKGGELFFHLRRVKKFTEEQARTFVAMIALALGHLHSLNFIYRDLVSLFVEENPKLNWSLET
jgi:serum/glucocorticoid-regulated kinase 2